MGCDYYGCIYNKNGHCDYEHSDMKIPYYTVCNQEDPDSVHASLYGD